MLEVGSLICGEVLRIVSRQRRPSVDRVFLSLEVPDLFPFFVLAEAGCLVAEHGQERYGRLLDQLADESGHVESSGTDEDLRSLHEERVA